MKSFQIFSTFVAGLLALAGRVQANAVFAHVIVGNTCSYSIGQWQSDIQLAQSVGIDAFALNIAPGGCTSAQISNAFSAANNLGGSFKMFFSFDYLGGGSPWAAGDVISLLKTYGPNGAHFRYGSGNKPLVSTFEGTSNIGDWDNIRSQVGGIFFVPDWTSLGPSGFQSHLQTVDGAFSWDMWPNGPNDSSYTNDQAWVNAIGGGKSFMAGVSPWFFTDLPGYNKAWVWRGDDMWHQRWEQVIQNQPPLVEIVTWNDFGESHYIGPIVSSGIPSGSNTNAHAYVDNMPHDHWRDLLPYYIAKYKNQNPSIPSEKVQYWYRLSPAAAGSNGGVTGNDCKSAINIYGYQTCYDPNVIVQDKVFVTALVSSPATVTIQIGGSGATSFSANTVGVNHFNVPFNGQTGAVTVKIVRNGQTVVSSTGASILASPPSGQTNYNAWVGGSG